MTPKSFGTRLRRARWAAGLSQCQLATAIKIRQPRISRYEDGATTPTLLIATQLAKALRVSLDKLCGLRPRKAPR